MIGVKDDEPKKHQRCTHALWAATVCSFANSTDADACNPEIDLQDVVEYQTDISDASKFVTVAHSGVGQQHARTLNTRVNNQTYILHHGRVSSALANGNAILLGIIQSDGRVAFIKQRIAISREFLDIAAKGREGKLLRHIVDGDQATTAIVLLHGGPVVWSSQPLFRIFPRPENVIACQHAAVLFRSASALS